MDIDFIIWIIIRYYIFLLTFSPLWWTKPFLLVPVSLQCVPIAVGLPLPLGGALPYFLALHCVPALLVHFLLPS